LSDWTERAELKVKRSQVPWDEETEYAKGFWAYAKEHYSRCLKLAMEISETVAKPNSYIFPYVLNAVFEKLASPLVYLHETWMFMPTDKKAKYNPQLAKIHEEAQKQVEQALKKEKVC
jgi:hypothetical protein